MVKQSPRRVVLVIPALFCLVVLVAGITLKAQELPLAAWTPPALPAETAEAPDGRDVINRLAAFMSGNSLLMTEALVSYEAVQESGQKFHFDLLQRVAIRKPDKVFWMTLRDDGTADKAWLTNGTFTMLKQPANIWGRVDGPTTIPAMVERLSTEYDLDVPFPDILIGDPKDLFLSDDVTAVEYVGEAWVEGHWTDHIAVRKPGVDYEIWVRKGDQPFPAKVAIVLTEEEGRPLYSARFRKWATAIPDSIDLKFTPPEGSERIEVAPVSAR
jgi:hypothetical protein